jgi:phage terminase large subunit GpA-like protein
MGFIGTFANLTGYKVGDFKVEGLAGRDAAGAPRWTVACRKCGQEQVLAHARMATALESKAVNNLVCANPSCPLSRSHDKESESFAEFRQRERREAEQAARQSKAEAAERQAEAAKGRAEFEKVAALRMEYRTYWNHQIQTEIEESKLISFKRWQQLQPDTRSLILDKIKTDPTIMVEGL